MKIKVKEKSFSDVSKIRRYKHIPPLKPSLLLTSVIKLLSKKELKDVNFSYQEKNMEKIKKHEPVLYIMNHSCFLDLKIAFKVIKNRRFNIIMTDDGFVGKNLIMRKIGCVPTMKFLNDPCLVKDMKFAVNVLHNSILIYPEASYSFDGTATPFPISVGKIVKLLNIPVVMIKTYGAFLRDPLYNNLQLRKVNVKADVECLITKDDIKTKTIEELFEIINSKFDFDGFKYQQENNITIDEPFRADSLNRVLYKCPYCNSEGTMLGEGINITCTNCNTKLVLTEKGYLKAENQKDIFTHVPDWYKWERENVKKEIEEGTYKEEMDVEIYILRDLKSLYHVGNGKLTHSIKGYLLEDNNNEFTYKQDVLDTYSIYSDFFWYELGDLICIGDYKMRYYCFPKNRKDIVAKLRIATEELYKLAKLDEKK